jgi:hypothetical protein
VRAERLSVGTTFEEKSETRLVEDTHVKRKRRRPAHGPRRSMDAMSIVEFQDDDDGYLRWTASHRSGYVINILRTLNPSTARLHHAYCPTITGEPAHGATWTGEYIKICSTSLAELERWALGEVRVEIQRCGHSGDW